MRGKDRKRKVLLIEDPSSLLGRSASLWLLLPCLLKNLIYLILCESYEDFVLPYHFLLISLKR